MEGVELPAIEFLKKMGWSYLSGSSIDVEFRNIAPIIVNDFKEGLIACNPWIDDIGIDKALGELRKINEDDLTSSNKLFWEKFLYKSSFQVQVDYEGKLLPKTVNFIDSVNISNNKFTVVNQFVGHDREGNIIKPDILLFVNGIPLGMIECKASHVKLSQGISQLLGYQKSAPKHFYFNQVCAAINRNSAKYGAINTPEQFYFSYRLDDEELDIVTSLVGEEPNEQEKLLWALFEPSRFVDLVKHFVLFEQEEFGIIKKLPRYQQWRAVKKTVKRLKQNEGGVVWHTQGSGKSLTMGMLARYIRTEEAGFDNPSILLLTDRTDLDRQISETFTNIGLNPERARSVEGLQNRLTNDYGGIFTSTIQKFQESKNTKKDLTAELEDEEAETRIRRVQRGDLWYMIEERKVDDEWIIEAEHQVDFSVLSTKKNFIVLVDEAHRSHYGFLGAFMRASLPNAKLVAFTGTPLLKEDKSTLGEFDGDNYIDVYALHEAVRDGFTLPIRYIDGVAEQTVDGLLDDDFDAKTEGLSDTKKALMKKQLIKERRLAPSRLREIAEHLVDHYEQNGYAKGFKAMLVCEGRPAAVKYKDILNEIMERREREGKVVFDSKVVISLGSITANRTGEEDGSIEERINRAIKNGEEPIALPSDQVPHFTNKLFKLPFGDESENTEQKVKYNNTAILIVSDMLLTGYDAPILNTLYLDKPLKEHTLLQAIARVNRTRKGKNAGYIVDYYGIVPHLDQALQVYGGDVQSTDLMEGPEADIPKLEAACEAILIMLPKRYDIVEESEKYKADAERKLDPISHLDRAEDFLEAFTKFNKLLAMVLPHPSAAKYKPYFLVFSELKITLLNALKDDQHKESVTSEESKLLSQLVEEHIKSSPVVSLLSHEVDIFDREELDKLKRLNSLSAALVMKNQLKHTISVGMGKAPGFFGALDEELKKLLKEEKEGRVEQYTFLEQLEGLLGKIRDKDNEAHNAGFKSYDEITVYNYLKEHTPEYATTVTENLFEQEEFSRTLENSNWYRTPAIVEGLEKVVRKELKGLSGWERQTTKQHSKKIVDLLKDK